MLKHFPGQDLVWIRHSGHVLRDELREVYGLLHADAVQTPPCRIFTDLAEVSIIDFGFSEIHWHVQRLQEQLRARNMSQVDSVHAPGSVVFGLARIYQQVADPDGPLQVYVHEQRDMALSVLGLDHVPEELL